MGQSKIHDSCGVRESETLLSERPAGALHRVREATLMFHSDGFTEFVISIICLTNWNKSGFKRIVLVTDVAA